MEKPPEPTVCPSLCLAGAVLVRGAGVLAGAGVRWPLRGDSSAKAKGTLTETSIPTESWQLAELTWGEPGENSAPQGQLITTGGDPQMILEDVSGRVVRTVSYNVEFDGDSREMCLYYTTKNGGALQPGPPRLPQSAGRRHLCVHPAAHPDRGTAAGSLQPR